MHSMRGLSLVEVMVTLAIGMIVTLGIVGIMGTNRQNLRITESLSESQENARLAFELIARDVRQARDTSCGPLQSVSNLPVVSVDPDNPADPDWWGVWWPIRGFAGDSDTAAISIGSNSEDRVAGTQALQLLGSGEVRIISTITPDGTTINLQTAAGSLNSGPIIVCDLLNASLHTAGAAGANAITTSPAVAVSDPANPQFQVARLTAVTWYIGNNGRANEGGRSLYRVRLQPDGFTVIEEILPGVVDMQVTYHLKNNVGFVASDDALLATQANWNDVNAIQLTLVTESTQRNVTSDAAAGSALVGSDGRIRRQITHVISLRNTI